MLPHCSHILMIDVLQQPDLHLSFMGALEQYVHDLQRCLHLLLTKILLSLRTLRVRSGDTDTSLQSFGCFCGPVRSGGADTN